MKLHGIARFTIRQKVSSGRDIRAVAVLLSPYMCKRFGYVRFWAASSLCARRQLFPLLQPRIEHSLSQFLFF